MGPDIQVSPHASARYHYVQQGFLTVTGKEAEYGLRCEKFRETKMVCYAIPQVEMCLVCGVDGRLFVKFSLQCFIVAQAKLEPNYFL